MSGLSNDPAVDETDTPPQGLVGPLTAVAGAIQKYGKSQMVEQRLQGRDLTEIGIAQSVGLPSQSRYRHFMCLPC